jgi:hypothetical protein
VVTAVIDCGRSLTTAHSDYHHIVFSDTVPLTLVSSINAHEAAPPGIRCGVMVAHPPKSSHGDFTDL